MQKCLFNYCYFKNLFLYLDAKQPKVRSHYRAHKISFWLHLVPELMRNGGTGISMFGPGSSDGNSGYQNIINSSKNHDKIMNLRLIKKN